MKRALIVFLGVAFVFALAASAGAIPSLGVWPGNLTSLEDATSLEGPFAFTGGVSEIITVWYGNEDNKRPSERQKTVYCSWFDNKTYR